MVLNVILGVSFDNLYDWKGTQEEAVELIVQKLL
jgi:hypothetical protein